VYLRKCRIAAIGLSLLYDRAAIDSNVLTCGEAGSHQVLDSFRNVFRLASSVDGMVFEIFVIELQALTTLVGFLAFVGR
jgi:hypothetical protein